MSAILHQAMMTGYGGRRDPLYSSVSLLLPFDGTNGSTTITDRGPLNLATSAVSGNAQISTAQSVFGGSSLALDGSGDDIRYAQNAAFDFGDGDFTIECWVRFAATTGDFQSIVRYGDPNSASNNTLSAFIFARNTNRTILCALYSGSTSSIISGTTVTNNDQWYAVCITRASGTVRLFVSGVQEATTSYGSSLNTTSGRQLMLGRWSGGGRELNGFVDEFRITKGHARYTANYTPASEAFPTQ